MNAPASIACSHSPNEQLGIFRSAATVLASSLELDATLINTIRVFLPALGDFGFFDAIVDGGVKRTVAAHNDPALEAMLSTTAWARQEHALDMNLCALSNGEPAIHHAIDDAWYQRIAVNDGHLGVLRELAFTSMLTVPVRCGDELIGALTLFMGVSRRPYLDGDLVFAGELAALAAPVVNNARLLARQRDAELALRASEERLRLAVGAGRIGIWDWHTHTGQVSWSDEMYPLHGRAPGQFDGQVESVMQQVHPDDVARVAEALERCRAERTVMTAQFRIIHPDGKVVWLDCWAQCSGEGIHERVIGTSMDVSAQRNLNEALEQRVLERTTERDRIWRMSRDVLAVLSRSGDLVASNPAFTALLGWTEDSAASLALLVHPDQQAAWLACLNGVAVAEELEVQVRHRDGGYRWLSWTLAPEGELVYGVGRDVTQWKRQREQVEQVSEMRLQLALEAGGMGGWQWDVRTGQSWWWPGMAELHGCAQAPSGPIDAYLALVLPEDRPTLAAVVENALRTGDDYQAEYRIVLPDGTVRWLEGRGKLHRDEQGEVVQVAGVCVDISARKRLEQDLRFVAQASESLASLDDIHATLQRVAELAVPHFADWCTFDLVDVDRKVARVAVAHVDPHKVALAQRLFERYPPQDGDQSVLWRVLASGKPETNSDIRSAQLERVARSSEHLAMLRELGLRSYITVPLAVRGRILGVITFVTAEGGRRYGPEDVALAEDIGNRAAVALDNAKLYRALQKADQRKDEFLAMLAHELRNPLAPIRAAADLLALNQGDSRLSSISGVLSRQVNHMTGLVNDLLDVSRVTRGNIVLDNAPADVRGVIAAAVEQARPLINARNHQVHVDVAAGPMTVLGDEKRLVQILVNLLNNAAKYTPPGGRIDVLARAEGGEVLLDILDTGIGMSAELVNTAFELFAQAARASDRAQGGLGLGLALVRRLVELHGGQVRAFSQGEGQGSRFVVRLPLMQDAQLRADPASVALPAGPSSLRVLLVDDNIDAATVLGAFLEAAGHQVDVSYEPHAALRKVRRQAYDVCLLDIGLPGMDGHALARHIRAECPAPAPVLIAVTGYGQSHDRSAAMAAGFDHYLVKPVEALNLTALLAQIAARPPMH